MGVLRITVDHGVRIDAVAARVHVTLRAQSSLAATAAAKKVAEVRTLVEAQATRGTTPMDMGMTIRSSTELSVHLTVDFDVSAHSA